jgi:hypothetical protein
MRQRVWLHGRAMPGKPVAALLRIADLQAGWRWTHGRRRLLRVRAEA